MNARRGLYGYQYFSVLLLLSLSGVFYPGLVRGAAGTGAFAAFLIAAVLGLPIVLLQADVFGRRGGLLSGYSEAFGTRTAAVLCALSALFFIYIGAETLSLLRLYINISSYDMPAVTVLVLTAAGAAIAATGESAVTGRTAAVLCIAAAALLLTLTVVFALRADPANLFPLVSASPRTLLKVSLFLTASQYAQLLAAVPLCSAPGQRQRIVRISLFAAALGGCASILSALLSLMVGGQTSADAVYNISYTGGAGLHGLKALAASLLFLTAIFRTAVSVRAATVCLGDALSIKKRKPLAFAAGGAVLLAQPVFPRDTAGLAFFLMTYSFYIPVLPALVLPLAAAIAQKAKRRHSAQTKAQRRRDRSRQNTTRR